MYEGARRLAAPARAAATARAADLTEAGRVAEAFGEVAATARGVPLRLAGRLPVRAAPGRAAALAVFWGARPAVFFTVRVAVAGFAVTLRAVRGLAAALGDAFFPRVLEGLRLRDVAIDAFLM
ncbi:MAG: hypothetical protein ACREPF_03420 [Rhodanobacteraceae bacterium]